MNVSQIASRLRARGKHRASPLLIGPVKLGPISPANLGQAMGAVLSPLFTCQHVAPDGSNVRYAAAVVFTDDRHYHVLTDAPPDAVLDMIGQEFGLLRPPPGLSVDDWPDLPPFDVPGI